MVPSPGSRELRGQSHDNLAEELIMKVEQSRKRQLTILAAARNGDEHIYKDDISSWLENPEVDAVAAIDAPEPGWTGKVGYAAAVLKEMAPSPENTYAVVCGPPIMLDTCLKVLDELKFPRDRSLTSLERRMKCGIGKCGRCNIGPLYVCLDGPVFTSARLNEIGG